MFSNGLVFFICVVSTVSNGFLLPFFTPNRFKNIVIFGDSGSDNGNAYKLTSKVYPPSPPYYKGRFCNGPIWVDQLDVSGIRDYAYGGATSDNNLVQGYVLAGTQLVPVPGLRQQVQLYLNSNPPNKIDFARKLFIFEGGGNNFILNNSLTPDVVVNSVLDGVRDILAKGAKHVLIFNQPPLDKFPFARLFNLQAVFAAIANLTNLLFINDLKVIQDNYPQASLNVFDINSLITKVTTAPTKYFTNVTANCLQTFNPATPLNLGPPVQLCSNPNKYVWWDEFHFSSHVHGLIAEPIRLFLLDSYEVNSGTCYIHPVRSL